MRLTLKTCLALGLLTTLFSCTGNHPSPGEDRKFETDGMELAMRQEFLMTRDPRLNDVPKDRLEAARALKQGLVQTARMQALSWQERGPNNIGGRTRAMIVDRRDGSGNTVLAASVSGGIFRTTNFTAATPQWVPINDRLVNLAVTAMKQDRINPLIMYAGTGEGWFNVDAVRGAGIYKSTDGGLSWNLLPSTATFEYVQDIDVDNNGYVYASLRNLRTDNRGVVRSTDGGLTWVQVLGAPLPGFITGRAADLEVAANGDVYATLGIFSKTMVMKSAASNGANTGARGTWEEITPVYSKKTQRAELAIAPSNSQRLYLLMQDSASSEVDYIFKSSNGGATWDSLAAPSVLNNGDNSQTWYNLIAAVDPGNENVVVVGGLHLAKTVDGGANWTTISSNSTVHVDQHELIYLTSSRLYVGNDGGVYYSENMNVATGIPAFQNKNNTYNVTQFYAVDYHPTNTNFFLAGAQDNNTQRFTQPGINTTSAAVGGDGGFPHIDQNEPTLQIASTTANNYFRSTNGGQTFSYQSAVSNTEGQFINPTDYDDAANVLYCGHGKGKYYFISNWSTNSGTSPSGTVVSLSDMGEREVTAVKWDHLGANMVWIGASLNNSAPKLIKLGDANTATPKVLVSETLSVPANAYISSIDVDPNDWRHVLVTLSNYGVASVFESRDGGFNWTNVEGNLPDMPVRWGMFVPNTATVDGTNAGGILLGTELGVWFAPQTNGASTAWQPENTNFPNVRVDMLKFRTTDRLLLAATHGRGLYSTTLTASSTGVPSVPDTKDFIRYISSGAQELLIKVGNLTTTKMQVSIYDIKGRLVSASDTRYTDQRIDTRRLARGAYVLKIFGNRGERYTRQFIK